ncbi:Domain of unknown function DUF1814 [Desulfurobacterium thermolithotrophum DSM 11699]|uniref:Nucleotidyl transferase AbiEii toxin, Type IV TA system n=1 Tax=Desulfurobacterium thermolithotrophum (strain DSM 11699 / BSA) TaxID=868864 RepID=F0S0U9_DESTD|nr:nucleotidyl transferase AbiEii/AbiGii toxin family protein [Desulfurobacterium thermolithotrophum]ADY72753.1 Domain of unknown function DUF1814 [Desulfurobacterium thermolithotrophum DSM 11699]
MKRLKEKQREVLEKLVKSGITEGFYLAGGTALLIRYGHRESDDFDFFSFSQNKNLDFFRRIQKIPSEFLKVEELKSDTLIFYLNSVKFSFFEYPYPVLKFPDRFEKLGIYVASDEDIAAMKAVAVIQRGSKKDFFDLYFLIKKNNWELEKIITFCKEKYGNVFPEPAFLKALTYFKEAELESYKDIDVEWNSIKNFFIKTVTDYVTSL